MIFLWLLVIFLLFIHYPFHHLKTTFYLKFSYLKFVIIYPSLRIRLFEHFRSVIPLNAICRNWLFLSPSDIFLDYICKSLGKSIWSSYRTRKFQWLLSQGSYYALKTLTSQNTGKFDYHFLYRYVLSILFHFNISPRPKINVKLYFRLIRFHIILLLSLWFFYLPSFKIIFLTLISFEFDFSGFPPFFPN